MVIPERFRAPLLIPAAALWLAACGDKAAAPAPPPAHVKVFTVQAETLPIVSELPGRLSATRVAEVRARVPGIVLKREFTEGSEVQAGQVLFRIDPAPLRAAYDSAKASLAQAEADRFRAETLLKRYESLVTEHAVSQQEYDDARAAQKQAQAQVAAARAAVETARIDLDYATVRAPIDGRIGRALVTEGALVGQGEATPLARIQQLDPIYADFTQSVVAMRALRRAFDDGRIRRVDEQAAQVRLLTGGARLYALPGKLLFSDITVDPDTAQVSLRGQFPNPSRELLPGEYVRVRLEQAVSEQALAIPQQAVLRNSGGESLVMRVVVADGGKTTVQQTAVRLGSTIGDRWIVEDGLKAGDQVVVEGHQHIRSGAAVEPEPWQSPSGETH